jgi:hypothetical protein
VLCRNLSTNVANILISPDFLKLSICPIFSELFSSKFILNNILPIISNIFPDISDKFQSGLSTIYSPKRYLQHCCPPPQAMHPLCSISLGLGDCRVCPYLEGDIPNDVLTSPMSPRCFLPKTESPLCFQGYLNDPI